MVTSFGMWRAWLWVSLCDTSPDEENGTSPWDTSGRGWAARRVSEWYSNHEVGSVSTSLEVQGLRQYNRSHEAEGWATMRVLDASISGPQI